MFNKTKIAGALATVITGAALSVPAQAVNLTDNGLGDAALFQYYTATDSWQTFIRLANTSDNAIAVKVRFREAANSREVLDFTVFLSPNDIWSGWTDAEAATDALGNTVPGIRTNDTSCISPLAGNSDPGEGFDTVKPGVLAAAFKTRSFTGPYDDSSQVSDPTTRVAEGHIEVIGISSYAPGTDAYRAIKHSPLTDVPSDCGTAVGEYEAGISLGDAKDVDNVIAANAYLINISAGQGAGYDPTILGNFTNRSLAAIANQSQTLPDLDNARPVSRTRNENGTVTTNYWSDNNDIALNQELANGATGVAGSVPVSYHVDINRSLQTGDLAASGLTVAESGVDMDGNGTCEGAELVLDDETIGTALHAFLFDATGNPTKYLINTGLAQNGCVSFVTPDPLGLVFGTYPPVTYGVATSTTVSRTKQKGVAGASAVTGGVDAVSAVLMRSQVINEWAARPKPGATISDYYTQWVLTFPTKNYYVDLATDTIAADDVSAMLRDPSPGNDAYAPFSQEFDIAGRSCESYTAELYNVEENEKGFTSPGPFDTAEICYETNVLTFHDEYSNRGLKSGFATSVPTSFLPTDWDGSRSQRGLAKLLFTGTGTNEGLTGFNAQKDQEKQHFGGLPVHGFSLSIFNTNGAANNHTAIHDHKYKTDIVNLP